MVKTVLKISGDVLKRERTRQAGSKADWARGQVSSAPLRLSLSGGRLLAALRCQESTRSPELTTGWNQMDNSRRNTLPFSRLRERARSGFQKRSQKTRRSSGGARVTSKFQPSSQRVQKVSQQVAARKAASNQRLGQRRTGSISPSSSFSLPASSFLRQRHSDESHRATEPHSAPNKPPGGPSPQQWNLPASACGSLEPAQASHPPTTPGARHQSASPCSFGIPCNSLAPLIRARRPFQAIDNSSSKVADIHLQTRRHTNQAEKRSRD